MDGTGVVIVAIPSEDDYVWRVSSEKVPHMTLLYLGDLTPNTNLSRIEQYLGHVAESTMRRFGMSVDHRGELGEKNADVLFFGETKSQKNLEVIRQYLLASPDISRAYNSATQYPSWTPHLTLGYPATPANPDKREYPGISWVNFDRVALWTGDYEGPTFLLKEQWSMDPVRMSDDSPKTISHFGVKGMRWGQHKNTVETAKRIGGLAGKAASSRKTTETKKTFDKKVKETGGLHKVSDKELQSMLNRLEMEKKYSKILNEDKAKRAEGRAAALKLLGEVGKIALPVLLGLAVGKVANNRGTFRTSATVTRTVIDGASKRLGS